MTKVKKLIETLHFEVDGDKLSVSGPMDEIKIHEKFIRTHKAEIIAELKAIEAAKLQREENIRNIEGLEELKQVIADWDNYHHEYNRRFEAEDYRPLAQPTDTVEEIRAKYPRAAAFLKAKDWTYSNNVDKYSAGKKALERIINGEDHERVLVDMDEEFTQAVRKNIWD